MKKLAFYILGFCLIPFYLLRNLKLFPSHPQSFEIGTLLLSTTTACATTRTADHQHRPETTTTGGETSQASYQETPWGSTLEKSKSMIFSNLNGGQSDLQRRSTNLRFWNLTLVLQLTIRKSMLLVVSSSVDASGPDATSQSETTRKIDFLIVNCSTNVKFQNLKFVERLWRSDCPPLKFV